MERSRFYETGRANMKPQEPSSKKDDWHAELTKRIATLKKNRTNLMCKKKYYFD